MLSQQFCLPACPTWHTCPWGSHPAPSALARDAARMCPCWQPGSITTGQEWLTEIEGSVIVKWIQMDAGLMEKDKASSSQQPQ